MNILTLLLYSILVALPLTLVIELFHHRLNIASTLHWVAKHFSLFLCTIFSSCALLLLYTGLFNSFALAICAAALCALLLGYTNYLMLCYREQPFLPRDFIMALNLNRLLSMISPTNVAIIATALLAAVTAGIFIHQAVGSLFLSAALRWLLVVIGLLLLLLYCSAGKERSPLRNCMIVCGADFNRFAQYGNFIDSFAHHGFLAAFFSLCMHPLMEPPASLSPQHPKHSAVASTSCSCGSLRKPHILFVMSEAFSDPTKIVNLQLTQDPIPHIHNIMQHTPSGQVLAPGYGGGTANCEFEALTGFSTALTGGISPFENGVHKRPGFPSIAWHLRSQGYRTVALHPYKRGMYARTQAYPNMGLESFIDIEGMQHTKTIDNNPYVSDFEAYAEILDMLGNATAPLFVHLVTMQNHGDYIKPDRFHTTIKACGLTHCKDLISIENYIQGIQYTDQATHAFLQALEQLQDEVLVVFWGDHLPGAYPPGFLRDDRRIMYETPFFLWSNRGLNPIHLGTRSPMMLSSLLLKQAGLHLRPYDTFLLDLQKELHGIHSRFFIDAQQRLIAHEQLSPKGMQLLQRLHQVQYQAFFGVQGSPALDLFLTPQ